MATLKAPLRYSLFRRTVNCRALSELLFLPACRSCLPTSRFCYNGLMSQSMPRLTCLRCGHHWTPQKNPYPDRCGNNRCRTPYWDRARQGDNILGTHQNNQKETNSRTDDKKPLTQADLDLNNQLEQLSWENAELTKKLQKLEQETGTNDKPRQGPWRITFHLNETTGEYEPEPPAKLLHLRLQDYLGHAQDCPSCKDHLAQYDQRVITRFTSRMEKVFDKL